MSNTTNSPADHVRLGAISAAIWANPTEHGTRYSVTLERLYRDPETGSWKSSSSFNRDDLLVLGKVADLAHTRIHQMQASDRDQNREQEAEASGSRSPTSGSGGAAASPAAAKAKTKANFKARA